MTWFKVDDTLAFHHKALKAGNAALGLWVRAGSWSSQQLTDGYIPEPVARQLGSEVQATRLVAAGLWLEADGGYQFHQWTACNPPAAVIHERRKRAAQQQQERRTRERHDQDPEDFNSKVVQDQHDDLEKKIGCFLENPSSEAVVRYNVETSGKPDPTRPNNKHSRARAREEPDQPSLEGMPAEPPPAAARRAKNTPGFDEFWTIYPRKVGKKAAQKAWIKAIQDKPDIMAIIAAARRYAADPRRITDPQYTAHPATWLNQGRYDDEPDVPPRGTRTASELNVGFWGAARGK
jgi:hypothetical protein